MDHFSSNFGAIAQKPTSRHVRWPPVTIDVQKLGHVVDTNRKDYPRDIGRSSEFGGDIVVQFGDTFAHDRHNNLVLSASSSVAVVHNPQNAPNMTTYSVDQAGRVEALIPALASEHEGLRSRSTLRCYGGIIEIGEQVGGITAGWIFYQKGIQYLQPPEENVFEYTGLAKIYYDVNQKKISVKRMQNPLIMFQCTEPKFGTFSTTVQDDYAYLFGHAHKSYKLMLARVHTRCVLDRSQYTYWDGKKYQGDMSKASIVMENVRHGAIYRSKLFQPDKGRDWVFVGGSPYSDNEVVLGVSANLEGPYTKVMLMATFPMPPISESQNRYCIYPHPWAFKEEEGELMITWCEGSINGNVVAVKVRLAMTMDIAPPSVDKPKKHRTSCVMS